MTISDNRPDEYAFLSRLAMTACVVAALFAGASAVFGQEQPAEVGSSTGDFTYHADSKTLAVNAVCTPKLECVVDEATEVRVINGNREINEVAGFLEAANLAKGRQATMLCWYKTSEEKGPKKLATRIILHFNNPPE